MFNAMEYAHYDILLETFKHFYREYGSPRLTIPSGLAKYSIFEYPAPSNLRPSYPQSHIIAIYQTGLKH